MSPISAPALEDKALKSSSFPFRGQCRVVCVTFFKIPRMKDLSVIDSTPGTLYPKIVSIANQEVFSLQVCKKSSCLHQGTVL